MAQDGSDSNMDDVPMTAAEAESPQAPVRTLDLDAIEAWGAPDAPLETTEATTVEEDVGGFCHNHPLALNCL